jgi:diacylglycerol kinase family enzyme
LALAALAALVALCIGLVALIVDSFRDLAEVGPGVVLDVAILAAAGWWAFTTRGVWKRRLNLAVVVLAVGGLLAGLVYLGVAHAIELLAVVVLAVAYAVAARRVLSGGGQAAADQAARGDAPAPSRPWLLINPNSGGGKVQRLGLAEAATRRGIQVRVLEPGDDPRALACDAVTAGADAIGVAGGDGSLGPVAAVAMQHNVPFVCVPAGTRNHFAHDLGLDRAKPLAALAAFTGVERRVDAARVGDRVFLNNVSLGSYADLVREPGYRARKLAATWAVLPAALRGERAGLPVRVRDPEGRAHDQPLVLLVGNNRYDLRHPFHVGARHRLDASVLHVAALGLTTGARFAALLGRVALGNYVAGARWAEWTSTAVRVDAGVDRVPVGIDGEAAVLDTPMEFGTLPLALRVLVPPGTPTAGAANVHLFTPTTVRRLWAVVLGDHDR